MYVALKDRTGEKTPLGQLRAGFEQNFQFNVLLLQQLLRHVLYKGHLSGYDGAF